MNEDDFKIHSYESTMIIVTSKPRKFAVDVEYWFEQNPTWCVNSNVEFLKNASVNPSVGGGWYCDVKVLDKSDHWIMHITYKATQTGSEKFVKFITSLSQELDLSCLIQQP